jgi:hypothetical protein
MEKELIVKIDGVNWQRHLIKTHFIGVDDNFDEIVKKYVLPLARENDIIILCQKIVSIIQKRIVYKKDIRVGLWAKFLSKFVKKTPSGFSVGNPLKMQVAINVAGLPRVLLAGFLGFTAKLFGITGIFYRVVGNQVSEIDGFYGEAYPQYSNMGILGPKNCDDLCNDLRNKFNFSFAVADVNDLGGNILGVSKNLKGHEKLLYQILKDNPAGQSNAQTPIIILRK